MGLVRLTATDGWRLGTRRTEAGVCHREEHGRRRSGGAARACDLAEVSTLEPLSVRQVNYAFCLAVRPVRATEADLEAWAAALESNRENARGHVSRNPGLGRIRAAAIPRST